MRAPIWVSTNQPSPAGHGGIDSQVMNESAIVLERVSGPSGMEWKIIAQGIGTKGENWNLRPPVTTDLLDIIKKQHDEDPPRPGTYNIDLGGKTYQVAFDEEPNGDWIAQPGDRQTSVTSETRESFNSVAIEILLEQDAPKLFRATATWPDGRKRLVSWLEKSSAAAISAVGKIVVGVQWQSAAEAGSRVVQRGVGYLPRDWPLAQEDTICRIPVAFHCPTCNVSRSSSLTECGAMQGEIYCIFCDSTYRMTNAEMCNLRRVFEASPVAPSQQFSR